MLVERLRETLVETSRVGLRNKLPREMSDEIKSFLGGKRRRTKKSKKSRKRKSKRSKKRLSKN